MVFQPLCLDQMLRCDHRVRGVWSYVEHLDVSGFYGAIRAIEGHGGRPAIDPKILLALWLYATLEGVGSARKLERLTQEHYAYLWLCGGVTINHHTLSDFRTEHVERLDELLTESAAVLVHAGVAELRRVAQDGMRVRASAGADSFHRQEGLERCREEAREQVTRLKRELETDAASLERRERAARERAARERQARVEAALGELEKVRAGKKPEEREKARASTTDPEARVMKMPDGGFRPGYNVQLATTTKGQAIVGVSVDNVGSDMGKLAPMVEEVTQRHGQTPEEWLADGNFAKKEDLIQVSPPQGKTTVYAPVQKAKKEGVDPHQPRENDAPAVAEWRRRMGTPEAQEIYKERAQTAECVNAQARNRGLTQVGVRGARKVLAVALWFGIAHNLARALALGIPSASGP
jgi:transposase